MKNKHKQNRKGKRATFKGIKHGVKKISKTNKKIQLAILKLTTWYLVQYHRISIDPPPRSKFSESKGGGSIDSHKKNSKISAPTAGCCNVYFSLSPFLHAKKL